MAQGRRKWVGGSSGGVSTGSRNCCSHCFGWWCIPIVPPHLLKVHEVHAVLYYTLPLRTLKPEEKSNHGGDEAGHSLLKGGWPDISLPPLPPIPNPITDPFGSTRRRASSGLGGPNGPLRPCTANGECPIQIENMCFDSIAAWVSVRRLRFLFFVFVSSIRSG